MRKFKMNSGKTRSKWKRSRDFPPNRVSVIPTRLFFFARNFPLSDLSGAPPLRRKQKMSDLGNLQLSDFHYGKKIGEGTYGTVHCATAKGTQQKVALKQIKINT